MGMKYVSSVKAGTMRYLEFIVSRDGFGYRVGHVYEIPVRIKARKK